MHGFSLDAYIGFTYARRLALRLYTAFLPLVIFILEYNIYNYEGLRFFDYVRAADHIVWCCARSDIIADEVDYQSAARDMIRKDTN